MPDPQDWRADITMPDDETQTLADVLGVMRLNNLQRQAAFVEWLAGEWYDAKAAQDHDGCMCLASDADSDEQGWRPCPSNLCEREDHDHHDEGRAVDGE